MTRASFRAQARRPVTQRLALTAHDRERMAAAVAAGEQRRAAAAARERLARLAVCCMAVGLAVALFYAGTN